jgi:hypothetical protein
LRAIPAPFERDRLPNPPSQHFRKAPSGVRENHHMAALESAKAKLEVAANHWPPERALLDPAEVAAVLEALAKAAAIAAAAAPAPAAK